MSLEFIHGYRGFDTRNNLHYTVDGDIVYHAAGAGIVHNIRTKMQSFYLQHTDDIVCLSLNQNPKFKVIRLNPDCLSPYTCNDNFYMKRNWLMCDC